MGLEDGNVPTVPDFTLNADGELSVGNAETVKKEEGSSGETPIDTVSAILSNKIKPGELSKSFEKPIVKTPDSSTVVEAKTTETPKSTPEYDSLLEENRNLNARLQALEQHTNQEIETKTTEELKAEEEQFNNELQAITDEVLDFLEPEKKEKFLKLIDKIVTKRSETNSAQVKNYLEAQEQTSNELRQVFQIYDGQNGKPAVYQMKNLVDHVVGTFGKEIFSEYPLTTIFRVAENVPFMLWIAQKYPEQSKQMNFQQWAVASENVRKAYYKDKSVSPYSHLDKYINPSKSNGDKTVNADDKSSQVAELERTALNLVPNRGVGLAAESTSIVNRNKQPITSARMAIESALDEIGEI